MRFWASVSANDRYGSEAVVQMLIRCAAVRIRQIGPSDRYRPEGGARIKRVAVIARCNELNGR